MTTCLATTGRMSTGVGYGPSGIRTEENICELTQVKVRLIYEATIVLDGIGLPVSAGAGERWRKGARS